MTPRLRYVEISEFNACGDRLSSHEVFLSDLRDSRLVLACEAVPSYDATCYAVEPDDQTVAACNDRLIAPASEAGRACLAPASGH